MSGLHMSLDNLPPHLRSQAEMQLGITPATTPTTQPAAKPPQPTAHPTKRTSSLLKAPPKDTATKTPSRKRETLTPDRADSIVKAVKVSPDGNEVKFVLDVNPHSVPTAQQKGAFVGKDGKVHFFTKAKIAKAEKTFTKALSKYAHLTRQWGRVPYEVEFIYYFPYSSSTPKKNIHTIGPMLERPDASNLTKGIADSLTEAGMWEDDSLINNESSKKRRTTKPPCIVIKVKNLQPAFEALYRKEAEENASLFNPTPTPPKPLEIAPDPLEEHSTTTSSDSSDSSDSPDSSDNQQPPLSP